MALSTQEKLAVASEFLLQSPPGEVNDVFNDIRTIIADDTALEQGIVPALEQYNVEQFTVAELPGAKSPVLICRAAQVPNQQGRFLDPRSKQVFDFDHVQLKASNVEPFQPNESLEPFRVALEDALTTYASNHYSQGVASVFSLAQPFPVASTSSAPATEASNPTPEESEKAEDGDEEMKESGEESATAEEPVAEETPAEPSAAATEETGSLDKKFGVFVVGNRYNPSNFWTGRWRSHYEIDLESSSLSGQINVHVHYYEQGNVQMTSELPITATLAASASSDAAAVAKEAVKKISTLEREYQVSLNDSYAELSEKTFKELRRALPVHKQKLDWNRITSYKLNSELRKG